jgi:hypothetical protein
MRKLHMIIAASAAVLTVGICVAAAGFYNSVEIPFNAETRPAGAQLILPDESKGEVRRLRTFDGNGGGTDQVLRKDGFTQEIVYASFSDNRRLKETTWFPLKPGESQAAKKSVRYFAAAGIGTSSEQVWDENGNLIRSGELVKPTGNSNRWYFAVKLYQNGILVENQMHHTDGFVVQQDRMRPDGTTESSKRFTAPNNDSYWQTRYFLADGKTVDYQEDRSFGSYSVTRFWPGTDTKKEVSAVTPGNRVLQLFRADGTQARVFDEYKTLGYAWTDYSEKGKVAFKRYFARVVTKTADGKESERFVIRFVEEYDQEGVKLSRYEFDDKGQLVDVELHKSATRKTRTDYRFDKGVLVKRTEFNSENRVVRTVEKPEETVEFAIKREWYKVEARPAVEADRVNVDGEVSHGPY